MKKLKILFPAMALSMLMSSCAMHTGYVTNSASLSSANFSYPQRHLQGEAKATYVFGIGGLGKSTLVDAAKEDLLHNFPIQDNQTLANMTVNFKRSYFFFFSNIKCTITADVVEFND